MSHLESKIAANLLTGKLPITKGEVSEKFLKGARKALDIYLEWGAPHDVDLSGFTPVVHKKGGDKVACFFTLGVDSFYTLINNIDEIDDIIYVVGFEVRLKPQVLKEVIETIQRVADYFGKNAVFIHSNVRDRLDKFVEWYKYGHGPALASVALAHEHLYKKIYIAASNTMTIIQKASTHPYIDHLWSTETLQFVHDSPITRVEKMKKIAEHQFAVDLIRVCFQGKEYNCNKCEKCVRTMITLKLLGLESKSFGNLPSLADISEISKKSFGTITWPMWIQNIEEAEKMLKALKGQL